MAIVLLLLAACSSTPWEVTVTPDDFDGRAVDNPLFPLPVGATWTLEGDTEDGHEIVEIEVLGDTKDVAWGVTAVVVRDTVTVDGELAEDTSDWFAQDLDGNVWYMGEETCEYEGDECVSTEGAWEAGVDGALPGVQMWAEPQVGQVYYQEYLEGEAEDQAEVVALDQAVSVTAGDYTGCMQSLEWTDLEEDSEEDKWFCPGVGFVLEETEDERIELVEATGL